MKNAAFEIIEFDEIGSTNDVAAEYATKGAGQRLVIRARRQTAGRGRRGRKWQSLDGNLFFSLLLEFELADLGRLVMASALALLETVKQYDATADVWLKWPNDVLLNGAKVSGMLLEKAAGEYMVVGIGVNVAQSPQAAEMLYPTTSLQESGIITTSDDFLQKYLLLFEKNICRSASDLRAGWLKNAKGVGQKITVRQNGKKQSGIFKGIDENADLLLQVGAVTRKILAGDVFYSGDKNE